MPKDTHLLIEAYRQVYLEKTGSGKKVKRDAFLYLEPKGKKSEFAQCGTCTMFTGTGCLIFGPQIKVKAEDSCGLYVYGKPSLDMKGKEKKEVTPKEAGFVHREVRCENCKFFNSKESGCELYYSLNEKLPDMFDLVVKVNKFGCCNAQTPNK